MLFDPGISYWIFYPEETILLWQKIYSEGISQWFLFFGSWYLITSYRSLNDGMYGMPISKIILHYTQCYLVRTIKAVNSLESHSWNLCSSVWWRKLDVKSKAGSLWRTSRLASGQSTMLFSHWKIEVVKPGQITGLSNRMNATN